MGNIFRQKFVIVNPTLHGLGTVIMGIGILSLLVGAFTYSGEEFVFPAAGWFVLGMLTLVVGVMIFTHSLRR